MSDKRLDKLFKEKLGDRDFDYQGSYWADFEKSFNIDAAVNPGGSAGGGAIGNIISGVKIALIAAPVIIITGLTVFSPGPNKKTSVKEHVNIEQTAPIIDNQKSSRKNIKTTDLIQKNKKTTSDKSSKTLLLTSEDFAEPNSVASPSAINKNKDETSYSQGDNTNDAIDYPGKKRSGAVSFNDNSGPDKPSVNENDNNQQDNNYNPELYNDADNPESGNNNVAIVSMVSLAASTNQKSDNNITNDNFKSYEENIHPMAIESNKSATTENNYISENLLKNEAGSNANFTVMSKSLDGSETQVDSTLKTKKSAIRAFRPNRIKPVFSLAVHGDFTFISKELTSGLPEFSQMINQRNASESNKTAFTLGLEFETRYRGFSFTTGINRMSWGETVNYVSSPETLVVTDTTYIEIIDNSYWEVIPVDSNTFDSTYIIDIDTTIIQFTDTLLYEPSDNLGSTNGKTQITYVEIPIMVGYEYYFKKLILSVKGGVSIGFLTKTTGYYLNESASGLIPINTGYAVIRKTLLNLELGLGLGYKFYPKFDVFLNTGYKMNLNSVFSDPGVSQKYKAITLGIKLRYTF